MKYWFVLTALMLSACATAEKYAAIVRTWEGHDVNELMMRWGQPDQIYKLPNGMTVYSYLTEGGISVHKRGNATSNYDNLSYSSNTTVLANQCKTEFFIQGSKIKSWRFEGNICKAKVPPERSPKAASNGIVSAPLPPSNSVPDMPTPAAAPAPPPDPAQAARARIAAPAPPDEPKACTTTAIDGGSRTVCPP